MLWSLDHMPKGPERNRVQNVDSIISILFLTNIPILIIITLSMIIFHQRKSIETKNLKKKKKFTLTNVVDY